jgi:hypothetical protein
MAVNAQRFVIGGAFIAYQDASTTRKIATVVEVVCCASAKITFTK